MRARKITGSILALVLSALVFGVRAGEPELLDISGLVWLHGDQFLAVSDAKMPDEKALNRLSVLTLPNSLDGLGFRPVRTSYPGGKSSDLESAAGIPGTNLVLLCESGPDDAALQRIFLARVRNQKVPIIDVTSWNSFTRVENVEATAVSGSGRHRLFFWAERNQGATSTTINWAPLSLFPLEIGPPTGSVLFSLPEGMVDAAGTPLYNRAIVAMDIDSHGNVYTAASFDPEEIVADPDIGPFRSIVMKIGVASRGGITLDPQPTIVATLDGLKVESVAVREDGKGVELFVGTDDEYYGGVVRPVLLP